LRSLHLQVVFLDDDTRPDALEDLVLVHQLAAALDKALIGI
jgi:hypothetical protein